MEPQEPNSVKFYRNAYIFIQEDAFETVLCEMVAILSRSQCVNIQRNTSLGKLEISLLFMIIERILTWYYNGFTVDIEHMMHKYVSFNKGLTYV